MAKIEQLNEEQKALLPQFRSEWFSLGTRTERADRAKAEKAILAMRAEINVTTKPIFIWCQSPATSMLALHFLKSEQWKQFVRNLSDQIPGSSGDSLWDSLWASLWDSLGSEWWGQHEAYWIAFYLFCRDIVGVNFDAKRSRQLDMWRDIAESCCWWWCFENYVVVSERPTVCRMTEQEGRLHCEDGPALAFADGYALYRWHGVNVPTDVITDPRSITIARIDAENNAEVRRIMLERYGEAKYLQDSGAKLECKTADRHNIRRPHP